MKYKNKMIIFDLDGTLYQSESSYISAVKDIFKQHGNYDSLIKKYDDSFLYRFIGEPAHLFNKWLSGVFAKDMLPVILKEFDSFEIDNVIQNGVLYEDVEDVLKWLQENDFEIYLCSNASKIYLETVMKKFNLEKYFLEFHIPELKNDTKINMIWKILSRIKPDIGFVVGDRKHDIDAARENKLISIGASYGYGGEEVKEADFTISKITEVKNIVKKCIDKEEK